jgi:hypothetical protein
MYKLKKNSHLLQFKEKNYFKPMCCIIISNKLEENTNFYNMLKSTLIGLQYDKNYISIYLLNSDKFEDEHKTYNELDKEKPYFLMFFKSIQYEFFNNSINDFIPNIVSKICSINDGYLANISKAFTVVKEKVINEEIIKTVDNKNNDIIKNNKTNDVIDSKNNKKKISPEKKETESKKILEKISKESYEEYDLSEEKSVELLEQLSEDSENLSEKITNNSNNSSENNMNNDIKKKQKLLKEKQKILQELNNE